METAKDAVKSDRSEAVKDGGSGPEQGSTNENTGRPGYENEQRGVSGASTERSVTGV